MADPNQRENRPCVSAWTNVAADVRITNRPALLHGVVVLASSNGGGATVYAGRDANGRKIGTFKAWDEVSNPIHFSPPLDCEAGIYVGGCSHVDEILILWSPK